MIQTETPVVRVPLPLSHQCHLLRLLRPLLTTSAQRDDVYLFAAIATEPDPGCDGCVAELTVDQFARLQYVVERELIEATDADNTARQQVASEILFDVVGPAKHVSAGIVPAA